jgi:penicillin-binding protein 1A
MHIKIYYKKHYGYFWGGLFSTLFFLIIGFSYSYVASGLPNIQDLKTVKLPPPMRIYTQEGELMAEFGNRNQLFVKIDAVPPLLLNAFLATEDKRFWKHRGVDLFGLVRASFEFLTTGQKSQGGSTITMQVARNFYLTREKTFSRKFREIILALRIEGKFTKHQILELYLNKIYMGNRTFGIASAAQFYFNKSLSQLNLAEMALLAGLPKAPAMINPVSNLQAAKKRRDFVLSRMYHLNFISKGEYQAALDTPVRIPHFEPPTLNLLAPYAADMVREELYKRFGLDSDIEGYHVYTTIEARAQKAADAAIETNLLEYDKRHGYRGPEKFLGQLTVDNLSELLDGLQHISTINQLMPAVVIELEENHLTALLGSGLPIVIDRAGWDWILTHDQESISNYLKPGDVIRVYAQHDHWYLGQIPKIQTALVALDPQNGAIKALSGGFSYKASQFNRASQAARQPGSGFKPFIYAAALNKGYTLADVFNDAPLVFDMPGHTMPWRPKNVNQDFRGLTRMREALVYSVNLVTVRILQTIGIPYALKYIERFGFETKQWPKNLSLALGSGEITPLAMARGYAVFANGGYRITPYLIKHVTDHQGHLLYEAQPQRAPSFDDQNHPTSSAPLHADYAPKVISSEVAFLITSVLQDVVRHGTAQSIRSLERLDLAGKTGTTNDRVDSWFNGYNGHMVTSVWVGFDQPRSLKEYAVALPIWQDFMKTVLKDLPERTLPKPPTINMLPINPVTGARLHEETPDMIGEYFHTHLVEQPKVNKMRLWWASKKPNTEEPLF